MTDRKRMLLWASAAGLLTALCWLPLGAAPLLPLALIPLFRGLRYIRRPLDAVLFALTLTTVGHLVGAHYIFALLKYSWLAPVISLLDIAFYVPFTIIGVLGAFWIERRTGLPRTIAFVLVYSPLEWLRTLSDLSLPTDQFAHVFSTHPQWLAFSPWTGPFFVSLLTLSVAALLDAAIEARIRRGRAALAVAAAVVLWLAPPLTDIVLERDPGDTTGTLRVGIVQPSVGIEKKLDRRYWPETERLLERLTFEAASGADLVVWPETARPGPVLWREDRPFADPRMEQLARSIGVPILYGCEVAVVVDRQVVALYNAAALARPDGRPTEWYGKQRLLPFVEGVPFAEAIGYDPAKAKRKSGGKKSYLTLLGNFKPGPEPTVFEVGEARIGALICYEGLYEQLIRRYRKEGANALCVMTNDAWWGRTIFAKWHAMMIAARAREADVPVIRAANSGISSLTGRDGKMTEATGLFEVKTLQVELAPSDSPPTFHSRHGNLIIGILLAVNGLLILWGIGRRFVGREPGRS